MPDFWLDTDSFVTPSRGPYRFTTVPGFWEFLEQKAAENVIASPALVLNELLEVEDRLRLWAKEQEGKLFLPPTEVVQEVLKQVVTNVTSNNRYATHHTVAFLSGADPWIIAYAKALGGRVVTFERSEPTSRKPKIPDVAGEFGVNCLNLWDMLTELGVTF
jgi:hypothetical protein